MTRVLLLIFTIFLVSSCGKKIEDSQPESIVDRGSRNSGNSPQPMPNLSLDDFIKKQKFTCSDKHSCPENIVKLIVVDNEQFRTCTGTLLYGSRVITSASCLPRSLQISNVSCRNKVFAIFPETRLQAQEVVGCDETKFADLNLESDPVLWKQDHAVLKLDKKMLRSPRYMSGLGANDVRKIFSYAVERQNDFESILVKKTCDIVFNSYANPFSVHRFSPMLSAVDCDFENGAKGAPIFQDNTLIGTFSSEMKPYLYKFLKESDLLSESIGRYFHISNLGCSQYLRMYFGTPSECNVIITRNRRDTLRTKMLRSKSLHLAKMQELEEQVEKPKKYFLWDLKFYGDYRSSNYEAHLAKPRCIYRSKKWIRGFRSRVTRKIYSKARIIVDIPHFIFSTKLDRELKPTSVMSDEGLKSYEIEFNPYRAHVKKNTYVKITSELHGAISSIKYDDVSADCNKR